MYFENINEKNDFLTVTREIIKGKVQISDKKEALKEIREKIKSLFLQKGEIPPSELVNLYFVFKNVKTKEDSYINSHKDVLKNYYENCTNEERFLINNLLFILDIVNGNPREGYEDYIKRGLIFKVDENNYQNEELVVFKQFLLCDKQDEKELLHVLKKIIKKENFFSLDGRAKRAVFVNALSFIWNNKKMFNNRIWLELFEDLSTLLEKLIELEMIEEQMYVHFFTYHIYGNNIEKFEDWYEFSEKVEKKASEFYKRWGEKHGLSKAKEKADSQKIGILIDRLVFNSPFKVIYALLNVLAKKYEIYVYSMNYVDKQPDSQNIIDALESLGVKVVSYQNYFIKDGYYYSHLKKALMLRETIIKDGIDYLITMTFGYDIPNFIFSNRSAPKQIFWSHGNCTSEVLNIDKKISHFPQQCEGFETFEIPKIREFLIGDEKDEENAEIIKKSFKEKYGEDVVILGCIGRLIKIDDEEYIKIVFEIMKRNKNTIYLACGTGNKETIIKKLDKYGIDKKRFIFTGQINPHVYGRVIDLYLAPFENPGEALEEYRHKIRPYVALHSKEWLEDVKKNFKDDPEKFILKDIYTDEDLKKAMNTEPLIEENRYAFLYKLIPNVLNKEDYLKVALRMLEDEQLKNKILKEYEYGLRNYEYDAEKFIKVLND